MWGRLVTAMVIPSRRHGLGRPAGCLPCVTPGPRLGRLACRPRGLTLTPCMPCSFGLLWSPWSGAGAQPNGVLGVTVTVRWIPLVPAAYGTEMARRGQQATGTAPGHRGPLTSGTRADVAWLVWAERATKEAT